VLAFAADASGNVAPLARLRGPESGIVRPRSIAIDADRYLYAANYADSFSTAESVTVYPPGAGANTPPVHTIAGLQTQLYQPLGIAVDGAKNIYVLNWDSVNVYAPGATGDVAPIRTLKGPNTKFVNPTGIAVSQEGRIYIPTLDGPNGGTFYVFAAGANGDTAPAQIINGPDGGLQQPVAVAVDARGYIYVVNEMSAGSAVMVYHRDANGDARPIRTLVGPRTGLHFARGIALDGAGNMYLPSEDVPASPPAILVFAAGAHGNVAPLRTIAGGLTNLSFETGIAVR
jgi:sugar lactone lactonase YvrE